MWIGACTPRVCVLIYIDALTMGSYTRFINHACGPRANTQSVLVEVEGVTRVKIVALRFIQPNTEILMDYKDPLFLNFECKCGSSMCRGVKVMPPQTQGQGLRDRVNVKVPTFATNAHKG